jgi:hypothetical protein
MVTAPGTPRARAPAMVTGLGILLAPVTVTSPGTLRARARFTVPGTLRARARLTVLGTPRARGKARRARPVRGPPVTKDPQQGRERAGDRTVPVDRTVRVQAPVRAPPADTAPPRGRATAPDRHPIPPRAPATARYPQGHRATAAEKTPARDQAPRRATARLAMVVESHKRSWAAMTDRNQVRRPALSARRGTGEPGTERSRAWLPHCARGSSRRPTRRVSVGIHQRTLRRVR